MSETSKNSEQEVKHLMNQLSIARTEINNLRQQIKSLNYLHQKECSSVKQTVQNWSCSSCSSRHVENDVQEEIPSNETTISLPYIGVINTNFPEKRGTPRQPGICSDTVAKLILNNDVFTNPEHSLEGLEEYSHMWILFHFHKNESTHVRAKVAPPRLNGLRTGVFATRSPHRPCPIGLSLVKIEQVEERTIYFSGVDMVDGTPVLDIKPYIPQYDSPGFTVPELNDSLHERLLDGRETDNVNQVSTFSLNDSVSSNRSESRIGEREAPDGEEEETPHTSGSSSSVLQTAMRMEVVTTPEGHVRVPAWINEPPVASLAVIFSDRALAQLQELQGANASDRQNTISNILREDPRSVYLRARWGNQYYTFRIAELHVSCKFDDTSHSVTVFQIRTADSITDE